jgi:hypothetical protein
MAQNTYSLIASYTCGGQFAQNVWHWQFDDALFTTTKSAAEALQIAFGALGHITALRQILDHKVTINSLRGSCVSSPGGFEAFTPVSGANAGLRGGDLSVSGLAPVLVHYPINLSLGRGRTFLPGISEDDVDDGIFSAGFRGAVATALATLFQNMVLTGGGGPTAIFGYWRAKQKVFVALPNTELSENLGTMKRRMRPA